MIFKLLFVGLRENIDISEDYLLWHWHAFQVTT